MIHIKYLKLVTDTVYKTVRLFGTFVFRSQYGFREKISIGVPSGSTLGPLLFLVYINDMHTFLQSQDTTLTLYADDGTITRSTNTTIKTESESECATLGIWLMQNKLSIDTLKKKCIRFSRQKKQQKSEIIYYLVNRWRCAEICC